MKNKGRLGNVPKGLSWINEQDEHQEITQTEEAPKTENAHSEDIPAKAIMQENNHEQVTTQMYTAPAEPITVEQEATKEPSQEKVELTSSLEFDESLSASENGLSKGWTRATFIITKDHLNKIKDLAWWERATIKEVMHDALKKYLEDKNINPRKRSSLISEEF